MSESSEGKDREKRLSRRQVLGGIVAGTAAAVAGVTAIHFRDANREDLEKQYHAARVYMEHDGGALLKNFQKLQQIGAKMKETGQRGTDADEKEIVAEKNKLLEEFDRVLIPKLLVQYAQSNMKQIKSLVQVYVYLGGDIKKVRENGPEGIDKKITENIASSMTYDIGRLPDNFGKVTHSPLEFVRKPLSRDSTK